jgi:hypothetical protein
MRKAAAVLVTIFALLLFSTTSVHATVSFESKIEDNIYVTCSFENLAQTVYDAAKANQQLFNGSTIPKIITANLEKQGLTRVTYGFQDNTYDDANKAIHVSFFLGGADVISYSVNRTSLKRAYQVKTDWRKFEVNLTSDFSVDFTQAFAEPVGTWQKIDYTNSAGSVHQAYFYETPETESLGKLSFKFILPSTATNVQANGDTITYDVPPSFEDIFLGSPLLILAAIIIVVVIALVYRRLK